MYTYLNTDRIYRYYLYCKRAFLLLLVIIPFQNCGDFQASQSAADLSLVAPSVFQCQSSDLRNPEKSELKRLNKNELTNTIHDILSRYLNKNETDNFMNQLGPLISAIPVDSIAEGMSHFDQVITSKHIDAQILLAERIANLIISNTTLSTKILGSCSQSINNSVCRRNFISSFGQLVYRRPLSSADIDWYESIFTGHVDGYENTIAALFSAPYFIYHYDVGESFVNSSSNSQVVNIDAYARASRLSYFYLQSLPDSELFAAAQNGSLMNTLGVQEQVNRLLLSPLVRKRLNTFFAKQLFKLDSTPAYRTDIAAVNTMLSGLSITESLNNRRQHMVDEVYDFLDYIIWEKKSGFSDLMTSELVFPRTQDLAEIYGTPVWNGSYALNDLVRAPAGQRAGILTKAQLLFTGSRSTRPIMRGVRVFNEFLCGELPPPADNDTPAGVVVEDHFSEREVVRTITEFPGSSCVGCHQGIINPLGFPYEMFDSFGRWRSTEDVFHPETSPSRGSVLVNKNLDTRTSINLGQSINASFADAVSISQELANNEKALACFNLKLWDFASKQPYKLGKNDCATTALYYEMKTSNSILEAIRALPLQPEFFKRTIQ